MHKVNPFDKSSDRYDAWFDLHGPAYGSEIKALRSLLPKRGDGLEVGVGTGRFAAPLGVRVGVDPSRAMARLAAKRGVHVRLGVGENLPFKDASFDFVLLVTTVCFLDDVPVAFREAYRVLRPGGGIILGLIDRNSPLGKFYEANKKDNIFYRDATFHSVDEVRSVLEQTGFRDFVFRQTIFQLPREMKEPDPVRPGYGKGGFVVIKATKISHRKMGT